MTYSKKFENRINKLGLYGKDVRVSYSGRKYVVDDPETFEIFEIFKNFDEIDNYLVTKEFEQIEKEDEEELIKSIEEEINETGFICESDNVERFVDTTIKEILENDEEKLEKRFEELVEAGENYLKENYKRVGAVARSGDYTGYFYKNDLNFETVENLENYFEI